MIQVFGHPASTCTLKVLCTLNELGLDHELKLVDLATGQHKQPEHVARQPFGKVPAIDDGGIALFESRAIIRYLADKGGSSLIPSDPKERGEMNQWIEVEQSYFSGPIMNFVFHHLFKRTQTEESLAGSREKLKRTLDVLEAHLKQKAGESPKYLAGSEFSLADIVYMPYLHYLALTPENSLLDAYPEVRGWWSHIRERGSWQKSTAQ